jgi:hypothetical protein
MSVRWIIFALGWGLSLFTWACNTGVAPRAPLTEQQTQNKLAAKKLTEEAYDLKLSGHNGRALTLFVKAHRLYAETLGESSFEVASNLDDQATVHFRIGDPVRAKNLYGKANRILSGSGPDGDRLKAGIERRLQTAAAFEKRGITCAEPLEPSGLPDGGLRPYFPNPGEVHPIFDRIGQALTGCIDGPPRQVSIRLVLTGDGQIVAARAKKPLGDSKQGRCLAEKLLEIGPKFTADLPRFRACFRNFTYPFIVRP